jgi:hypothetical protein
MSNSGGTMPAPEEVKVCKHDWREVTPMSHQCWCAYCGGISFDDGKTVTTPSLPPESEKMEEVLLKALQELDRLTPRKPNAITWERGVEILNVVQDEVVPAFLSRHQKGEHKP